ncbi:MAG: hypothetical protein J6C85_02920 [Alphaproteobacteria bacterium]|nr:hypothetical protein [Alphaproteobacteria bacterium]
MADPQRAELKASIKEDAMNANLANITPETLAADEKEAQQLIQQLQSPVSEEYSNLTPIKLRINQVHIGGLSTSIAHYGTTSKEKKELPDTIRQQPDKIIELAPVKIQEAAIKDESDIDANGYFDGKKIIITKYNLNDKQINNIKQDLQAQADQGEPVITDAPLAWDKFYKGNSISIEATINHEINHQAQDLKGNLHDPADERTTAMRKNRLTETTSNAVEYLTVANIYTKLKQEGKTTFTYEENGKKQTAPLDEILDYYPGLKDCVLQNGFSVDNPESIGKIVELSSQNWHKTHITAYNEQAKSSTIEKEMSFSSMLQKAAKEDEEISYKTDVKNMLKDVYIGHNTAIDLSPYSQYLDTMDLKEAQDLLCSITPRVQKKSISPETLFAINEYLEKQGLSTNQEKDDYIKKAFTEIVNRSPSADTTLKNLLMQNGGEIKYADGLIETYHIDPNIRTVQNGENGKKHIINNFTIPSQTNSNTAQQTKTAQENTPKQEPSAASLTAIQLKQIQNSR